MEPQKILKAWNYHRTIRKITTETSNIVISDQNIWSHNIKTTVLITSPDSLNSLYWSHSGSPYVILCFHITWSWWRCIGAILSRLLTCWLQKCDAFLRWMSKPVYGTMTNSVMVGLHVRKSYTQIRIAIGRNSFICTDGCSTSVTLKLEFGSTFWAIWFYQWRNVILHELSQKSFLKRRFLLGGYILIWLFL